MFSILQLIVEVGLQQRLDIVHNNNDLLDVNITELLVK